MSSLLHPRTARTIATTHTAVTSLSPCTSPALTQRLFSSTHNTSAQQRIPPESPHFINVPNPPQDQSIEALRELKRVRGFLPIPRRIFKHRDSHQKPENWWLRRAAPKPGPAAHARFEAARVKAEEGEGGAVAERQVWKRRMADSRRENMREGVKGLWRRKTKLDEKLDTVRKAKLSANRAAALAPEREDERLTHATVNLGTLQTAVLPDPDRLERGLAAAARTAAIEAFKSERRRDAVQTLYMNARTFVIDEAELEALVQREFADDHFESMGQSSTGYRIQNIWDAQNEPMSIADMMKDLQRASDSIIRDFTTESTRTNRRQKQVAEELTGGKMDTVK